MTRDSGNGANKQGEVYQRIIQEVIDTSVIDFEEAGVNASTLEELKQVSRAGTISFRCYLSFHSWSQGWLFSLLYPLLWRAAISLICASHTTFAGSLLYAALGGWLLLYFPVFFSHIGLPIRVILLVFGTISVLCYPCGTS